MARFCPRADPLTLDSMPPGSEGIIVSIMGGYGARKRLLDMGFIPGVKVRVISSNSGPLIVEIGGSTIALGRGLARKILVEPIDHG